MKIITEIRKGTEVMTKSPSCYVLEHLRHTTATILDYLQVTHVKGNIFKQKG